MFGQIDKTCRQNLTGKTDYTSRTNLTKRNLPLHMSLVKLKKWANSKYFPNLVISQVFSYIRDERT